MNFSDDKLNELIDIIYKYTKEPNDVIAIVCGIHDEDIEEFTTYLKNKKINDFHDILEYMMIFRNKKKYENDDLDEE